MTDSTKPVITVHAALGHDTGQLALRVFKCISDMNTVPDDWTHLPAADVDLIPYLSVIGEDPGNPVCDASLDDDGFLEVVCRGSYCEYEIAKVMRELLSQSDNGSTAHVEYRDADNAGFYVVSADKIDGAETATMLETFQRRIEGDLISLNDVTRVQHGTIVAALRMMQSALDDRMVSNELLAIISGADPRVSITSADIDVLIEQHIN